MLLPPVGSWFSGGALVVSVPALIGTSLSLVSLAPQIPDQQIFGGICGLSGLATAAVWLIAARENYLQKLYRNVMNWTPSKDSTPPLPPVKPLVQTHGDSAAVIKNAKLIKGRVLSYGAMYDRFNRKLENAHRSKTREDKAKSHLEKVMKRYFDANIKQDLRAVLNELNRKAYDEGPDSLPHMFGVYIRSGTFGALWARDMADFIDEAVQTIRILNKV